MIYQRMPIEIEAPEGIGYENIECNLSESSFTDQNLRDLGIRIDEVLLCYGDHVGKPELRALIAEENKVQADHVLICSGAAAGLFIVASSMLDKGDHIVIAKPNYATNIETPRAIGAEISFLQLRFEQQYDLDPDYLESLITDRTKLVSLTYPHNPTGVQISEERLNQFISIVEKKGSRLLLDETYREMSFMPPLPPAASISENVISISSMSKSFGLPGIRIGWIICRNKKWMEIFLAAKEQIFITNSVIDEEIAFQFLKNKEMHLGPIRQTIAKNFSIIKEFMAGQDKLEWVEPEGGCVCFPRVKAGKPFNARLYHEILLDRYGTYVGRGQWFDEDERHMRIGYSWEKTEKLKKGLQNILLAIEDLNS